MKTLVLGSAPSESDGLPWAPSAASTVRLAALVGVRPSKLREVFALDNLVEAPGPTREQLKKAALSYAFLPRSYRYILTGTEVVRAFGKRALPERDSKRLPWHRSGPGVLSWYRSAEGVELAVLPHPSGRNRWYNDVRCRRAAERFLRECAG